MTHRDMDVMGVCGLCQSHIYFDDFDFEYSRENIMYWCDNCHEVLLCANSENLESLNNGVFDKCATPLNQTEREDVIGENGIFKMKLQSDTMYIKKHAFAIEYVDNALQNGKLCTVGILSLKLFYVSCSQVKTETGSYYSDSDSDTEDDKCLAKVKAIYAKGESLNTDKRALFVPGGINVYTLSQARQLVQNKLSHDGIHLYYVGICSCCSREYTGWISGD